MAYPGMFFVLTLGISLGFAAYYFFKEQTTANANSNYTNESGYGNDYPCSSLQSYNEDDETRRRINKECTICLMSIGNTQRKILGCNHSFHRKCIEQWLQQSSTCPICRRDERM